MENDRPPGTEDNCSYAKDTRSQTRAATPVKEASPNGDDSDKAMEDKGMGPWNIMSTKTRRRGKGTNQGSVNHMEFQSSHAVGAPPTTVTIIGGASNNLFSLLES